MHGLKAAKISWEENFCQVFYLRDQKKKKISCRNTKFFWLKNKWEGKVYQAGIYLPVELFLHCTYVQKEETLGLLPSELYCPTISHFIRVSQASAESTRLLRLHRASRQCYAPIRQTFLPFQLFWSPLILDILIYSKSRNVTKLHSASTMCEPHSEHHYGQYMRVRILSGHV